MSRLVDFLKNTQKPIYHGPERTEWYRKRFNLYDREFPNYPFRIALDDDELLKLDEPFTDEPEIFIRDNRSSVMAWQEGYKPSSVSNLHDTNINIKKIGNTSITLRQILEEMANTPEYKKVKSRHWINLKEIYLLGKWNQYVTGWRSW